MTSAMELELVVAADGVVRCIYDEALDLREIGTLKIARASHVEPDRAGYWWADMGPVDGPVLGPFKNRTEALQAERGWLLEGSKRVVRTPPRVTILRFRASLCSHQQALSRHIPWPNAGGFCETRNWEMWLRLWLWPIWVFPCGTNLALRLSSRLYGMPQ